MLKNNRNRNGGQDGFTIIEVLIVLAIAGLILFAAATAPVAGPRPGV